MSTLLEYFARKMIARTSISEWLPHHAYDPDNQVYRLADGRIGCVWESPPLLGMGPDTIQKLTNLFESSQAPTGTTYQLMIHASPVIQPYLDAHVGLSDRGDPDSRFLRDATRTREFFLESQGTRLIPTSGIRPRDFNVYVSVTMPLKEEYPNGIEFEDIVEQLEGVEQTLRNVGLPVVRVPPLELIWLLHTLLSPGHAWEERPPSYNSTQLISDQVVARDTYAKLHARMFELDGKFVKSLTVQQFPEEWHGSKNRELIGSLLRGMDQITCPFFLTLNAVKLDQVNSVAALRKKHVVVTNQAVGFMLKLIPIFEKKLHHFNRMMALVAEGKQTIGLYVQAALYADDPKELEKHSSAIKAIYRTHDWLLQDDHFIGFRVFLFGLPMGLPSNVPLLRDDLRRLKTVHSDVPAHLAPIVGDWKGMGQPVMLLTSRSGQMMSLDVFANTEGNFNICIAADSGAGKSFFANFFFRSYLATGGQAWVIDAGKSYMKLCEHLKGQFMQFSREARKLCLNPLSRVIGRYDRKAESPEEEADRKDELAMIKAIFAQMLSPSRALTDLELSCLEQALIQVLADKGGESTPTDVAAVLLKMGQEREDQRIKDLGTQLFPYTAAGNYGDLFNGPNNMHFERDFYVLELDGLDALPDLRSVILLQMIMNIQVAMYQGDRARRKICAMDEAWDLLSQGGNVAAFFEKGVRRVRKYGGSIMTITQGINDYYDKMGQTGAALLANSDFVFLLKQKPESIESIKQRGRLILSEFEYQLLRSVHRGAGYSEIFFYTANHGRGIGRLTVDRRTQLMYSTKAEELALIDRIVKAGGPEMTIDRAIDLILEQEHERAAATGERVA